jgi:hypothetical protein
MGITTLKNNNMTYKYFILKQIDNEIVVIANKERCPWPKDNTRSVFSCRVYDKWEENHETFKPYGNKETKIIYGACFVKSNLDIADFDNSLEQGIEITCCEIREGFAFYKPEEQKEETIQEPQDILYSLLWLKSKRPLMDEDRFIEECKRGFTITRKSK